MRADTDAGPGLPLDPSLHSTPVEPGPASVSVLEALVERTKGELQATLERPAREQIRAYDTGLRLPRVSKWHKCRLEYGRAS